MNAGCETSHHGLVNRVGGLIRKDAGGQAGDHPDHTDFMRCLQHIVIDEDVVSLEKKKKIEIAVTEKNKKQTTISAFPLHLELPKT